MVSYLSLLAAEDASEPYPGCPGEQSAQVRETDAVVARNGLCLQSARSPPLCLKQRAVPRACRQLSHPDRFDDTISWRIGY